MLKPDNPPAPDHWSNSMLEGMMLMWFSLTAASVLFVAIDSRSTPASSVLKWAFGLFTLYGGPIGAFLYVLGCREPVEDTHQRYVAAMWRQTLGSTIHCVAGDGIGILVGAVVASTLLMTTPLEVALEYVLGFGFGWTIFQALFARAMAGGSYAKALRTTFLPEFLSMNCLMAAMIPVATLVRAYFPEARHPGNAAFWFAMSIALLAGFVAAYPINWWLVSRDLKHGMLTVRPGDNQDGSGASKREPGAAEAKQSASGVLLVAMTTLSLAVLALGLFAASSIEARA